MKESKLETVDIRLLKRYLRLTHEYIETQNIKLANAYLKQAEWKINEIIKGRANGKTA
jgi:hypothetical protein